MTAAMLLPALPFAAALVGLLLPQISAPSAPSAPLRSAPGAPSTPGPPSALRSAPAARISSRWAAAGLAVGGTAGALLLTLVLLVALDQPYGGYLELVRFGELAVSYGVRVDAPALVVAVAVGVVALAVQVYSVSYLAGDDRYPPYAAQVSLFTAAMLLVVVAGDLVVLLVGWEVMGICSYLLIAHDRRLPEAPGAAVKALLVTRAGDVGFWLGIILLGVHAGSFRIAEVLAAVTAGSLSPAVLTTAALLLLAGVAGKSAQFPLHTWLPDAMAGPTPISALIHAATMVAAGIYVVFRLFPVFQASTAALAALGVVAAVTMLLGALAATATDDIKRVLAWSTVSQLAYMAGALAIGATAAALFHLLAHAAFKALLFLGAGAVIHVVGSNLMSTMGGLRRPMPVTFWSMTIGLGALVGVPPLAGFWSKDAILAAANTSSGWVATLVFAAGLATVVVTAWYATRLWLRTFFGSPAPAPVVAAGPGAAPAEAAVPTRAAAGTVGSPQGPVPGQAAPELPGGVGTPPAAAVPAQAASGAVGSPPDVSTPVHTAVGEPAPGAAHDPPPLMAWPVVVLAIPSALLGLVALWQGFGGRLLRTPAPAEWVAGEYPPGAAEPVLAEPELVHIGLFMVVPLAAVVLGVVLAWAPWARDPAADPARVLGPLRTVFGRGFFLDQVQDTLVVRPVQALARVVRRGDETVVDGAVEGTGRGTLSLGALVALAHRAALPRAAAAVLAGALLVGLAAALLGGAG